MATDTQIKASILAWLNRTGATDLQETKWFEFAHREIQRRNNFKCMETTAKIDLVNNTKTYTEPVIDTAGATIQIKEFGWGAYTFKASDSTIIQFYQQTSYENILALRSNDSALNLSPDVDPETPYFAWYAGNIEIWPTPDTTVAAYDFYMPGWKFIATPTGGTTSWFTINAEDYLIFMGLLQSVPFLGGSNDRIKLWSEFADNAYNRIMGHDVQAKWAGPVRARG